MIRQRERSRYTPIIFISAIDALDSDVLSGAASGAVDYLFKPVVPEVLKAKIAVFVDVSQINERLKRQVIRESKEHFRLMVDSLEDYAVFMMDREGTLWNRRRADQGVDPGTNLRPVVRLLLRAKSEQDAPPIFCAKR